MKKNLLYTLLIGGVLASLSSCDVNSWNDKLDGFEGDPQATNKQSIEYTLTDADYAFIASNAANKALAGSELEKELQAVGTLKAFSEKIDVRSYAPNYFTDANFPYFTLSDGSAIKLTYKTIYGMPEAVAQVAGAKQYKLNTEDYIMAWDDDIDFVESFTPSITAASRMGDILKFRFADAVAGDAVIVDYEQADYEPDFGGEPVEPSYEMTSVLGTAAVGDNVHVVGVVTAVCNRGFIITDNGGSVLMYQSSGFMPSDWSVGDQVTLDGPVSSYNKGFQLAFESCTITKTGNMAYTYPAPEVMDGAKFDEVITRTADAPAVYATFVATASVSKYINFKVDGAATAQGSLYQGTDEQKAMFSDGVKYSITGYFSSISGGKFVNFIVTDVKPAAASAGMRAATVDSETVTAVYVYDGSRWDTMNGVVVLQKEDYLEMGQTYLNITEPDHYLPIWLKGSYPYAQAEDKKLVAYKLYKDGSTSYVCDSYIYNGTAWIKDNGAVEETAQFVRNNGKWMFDPNVTIVLPVGKGIEISTTYYQACVDWVYENVDKPLGSTGIKDGKFYVSKYGNNEYYSGTSAYQANVDLRAAKAREQYPAGYPDSMSDDDVVAKMKERFTKEVLPGALAKLHADAVPVPGLEVVYTVEFVVYTGSRATYVARYKVTAPGKFEFMDCTWDKAE